MKRLVVLTVALPLVALAAPRASGPYANKLSKIDIDQIQAAVSNEHGVPHNVRKIEAIRPDKVAVETGGKVGPNLASYYEFTVSKLAGKWTLDRSSIVITDEPQKSHGSDSDAIGR